MLYIIKGRTVQQIAEEIPSTLAELMLGRPLNDEEKTDKGIMLPVETFLNKIGKSIFENMTYKGERVKYSQNDNVFTPLLRLNKDENLKNMSIGLGNYLCDIFNNELENRRDLELNGSKDIVSQKSDAYISDERIKMFGDNYAKILTTFNSDFTQVQAAEKRKLGLNIDAYKKFAQEYFKRPLTAVRGWRDLAAKRFESVKTSINDRIEGGKTLDFKNNQHSCYENNLGKFYYTTGKNDVMEKVVFVPNDTPKKRIGIAFNSYDFDMSSKDGKFEGFIIDSYKGHKKVPFSLKKGEVIKSGFKPCQEGFDIKEKNIVGIAQMIGEAVLNDRGNIIRGGPQSIEFKGNKYRGGLTPMNKVMDAQRR